MFGIDFFLQIHSYHFKINVVGILWIIGILIIFPQPPSRPGLSEQRLSVNSQGKVIYQLKTPYENGTTRIVLDPLDFLSRLAFLVPRPKTNLIRFHGIFAPNFKHRRLITPKTKSPEKQATKSGKSSSMNWAGRLKRVFGMDIEVCSECGGKLKVISSIEEPEVIKKILNHLGLESGIPEPCSPRGPKRMRFSISHESSSLENSDGEPGFSVMDSLIQKFTFPTKSGLES